MTPFREIRLALQEWLFADPRLAVAIAPFNRTTPRSETLRRRRGQLPASMPNVRVSHVGGQHAPFMTNSGHGTQLRYRVQVKADETVEDVDAMADLQWAIFARLCDTRGNKINPNLGLPYVQRVMLESHTQPEDAGPDGWMSVLDVIVHASFDDAQLRPQPEE